MDLNLDFDFNTSQNLILTPRLKLALEILEMDSQGLFEYVEEQIEANPVLDMADASAEKCNGSFLASIEQLEWEKHLDAIKCIEMSELGSEMITSIEHEKNRSLFTLKEYLQYQFQTSNLKEDEIMIGEQLLDKIDENGYFSGNTEAISDEKKVEHDKVIAVLQQMQLMDPPGIMARNLRECLLIQIQRQGLYDKDVKRIIEDELDHLAEGKLVLVSKNTGVSHKKVSDLFNVLKTLEPKPAREFYESQDVKLVIPDIIVRKVNGVFEPKINYDAVPHLCICKYYTNILKQDISPETRKFIENKINNAAWLVKCIEHRSDILLKLAKNIVKLENNFFENGKQFKIPLDAAMTADKVGIHKSIVYKTLTEKYLQCSWGIFDMRYFLI